MSKKVLIVGGVAGGASAAARLRRLDEDVHIVMFERDPYISFANCGLPYYIGGSIQDRSKLLVQTPEAMHKRFNIDVRIQSEVVSIDPVNKKVRVESIEKAPMKRVMMRLFYRQVLNRFVRICLVSRVPKYTCCVTFPTLTKSKLKSLRKAHVRPW